jgi:hypothetical protein
MSGLFQIFIIQDKSSRDSPTSLERVYQSFDKEDLEFVVDNGKNDIIYGNENVLCNHSGKEKRVKN